MEPTNEVSTAHRSEPGAEERIAAVVAGIRQFSELSSDERAEAHARVDAAHAERVEATTFTPAKVGTAGPTEGQLHAMRSAVKRQPIE